MSRRVLVIGGTGAFGGRLVEGLAATTDFAVVIAARRGRAADALAAALRARYPGRAIEACALDASLVGADDLRRRLPRWFVPVSRASERVDAQGRFCFDIPVVLPAVGLLVHYRGWLVPKA
jgi:NAD(P)-dependent dehydrogenase (short-subunit alcohol dehydrogenase family)